jgi:hypothetical protein
MTTIAAAEGAGTSPREATVANKGILMVNCVSKVSLWLMHCQ